MIDAMRHTGRAWRLWVDRRVARLRRSQAFWFVLLWFAGVAGAALLALPFHLLVAMARA
jgi:hypothetical protein